MCDSSIPVPDFDFDELDEFDDITQFPKCDYKINLSDIIKIFGFELLSNSPIKSSSSSSVYAATLSSTASDESSKYWDDIPDKYALKISTNKSRLYNEFENYKKLPNTPNLVHSYDIYEIDDFLILQMELCQGGDIFGVTFDEDIIWKLIHDISNALNTLHTEELVHLDVSPSNILIDGSDFKLTDFGNIIESGSFKPGDEGAGPYVAPEVLHFPGTKETGFIHVWSAADIFSFGIVLIECITGVLAPRGGTFMYDKIRNGNLKLGQNQYKCNCSKELKDLVNQMINPDPIMRPTAWQIMMHPFVKKFDY